MVVFRRPVVVLCLGRSAVAEKALSESIMVHSNMASSRAPHGNKVKPCDLVHCEGESLSLSPHGALEMCGKAQRRRKLGLTHNNTVSRNSLLGDDDYRFSPF